MTLWMVALLFIGLGWLTLASTRQMHPVVVPGVTLATIMAMSSTSGHYDRALALLAMVGAVSVVKGKPKLAQVWRKLQPVVALAITLTAISIWPKTWYCNIYATWLLLLYPAGWWPLVLAGLGATRSISAVAGLAVAWVSHWPKLVIVGLPVILVVAVIGRPSSLMERKGIWAEAIRLFVQRPVLGWGTSAYYLSLANDLGMVRTTQYGHAHNVVLTVAVENGLLGLGAMLWLINRIRRGASVGLLAFAFQQLLDDTWLDPLSAVLLGLLIGSETEARYGTITG